MTRQELLADLRRHDWYHAYSDDHNVWRAGVNDARRLGEELTKLGCPHQWWDIHKALCEFAVEKYEIVGKFPNGDDEYRNPDWQYECIASQRRSDLLTQEEIDTILSWFKE